MSLMLATHCLYKLTQHKENAWMKVALCNLLPLEDGFLLHCLTSLTEKQIDCAVHGGPDLGH